MISVDVISKDNRSTKNNIELKDNTSSTTVLNNECTVKEIESVEITGNKSTTRSKTVNSFSTHTFHAAEVIQEKFAGINHLSLFHMVMQSCRHGEIGILSHMYSKANMSKPKPQKQSKSFEAYKLS